MSSVERASRPPLVAVARTTSFSSPQRAHTYCTRQCDNSRSLANAAIEQSRKSRPKPEKRQPPLAGEHSVTMRRGGRTEREGVSTLRDAHGRASGAPAT
jgi:hypothetical protein